MAGAYELVSFTVRFDTGVTLTQDNVRTWAGTFSITPTGNFTQRITLNGQTTVATGTIVVQSNTSFTFLNEQAACNSTVSFSLNANTLTTVLPSGTCGANFSETDVWRRVPAGAAASAFAVGPATDVVGVAGLLAGELTILDEDR